MHLQDTYLGNYKIPKEAMVIPLQWAIHMDPAIWEEPDEFRPSRFLADDGSLLKPQAFIPFQTGKEEITYNIITYKILKVCACHF